jgi:RimJ/RimL family protein N-acetyltransferase
MQSNLPQNLATGPPEPLPPVVLAEPVPEGSGRMIVVPAKPPGGVAPIGTTLAAAGIAIRCLGVEDAAGLFAAVQESLRELCAWMVWCHPQYTLNESLAFARDCAASWSNGSAYTFAIIDSVTGEFLGSVGLNRIDCTHKFANLGYWVRTGRTGRGIATNAVALAARFGLRDLGLKRIEIVVPVGNELSQRVAEKLGAQREGLLRQRILLHGEPHDAVLYSLLPTDQPPARNL